MVKEFWNERFGAAEYVYGRSPNNYFSNKLTTLKPGKLLVPGAGEGRDAVYAAKNGWDVLCFDLSESGQQKALRLAEEVGVSIGFDVMDGASIQQV